MRWTPLDVIVLLIALAFVSVILTPVISVFTTGERLSPPGFDLLEKLTMGALAVVSLYVGHRLKGKDD